MADTDALSRTFVGAICCIVTGKHNDTCLPMVEYVFRERGVSHGTCTRGRCSVKGKFLRSHAPVEGVP